jgi:hypothetical protein
MFRNYLSRSTQKSAYRAESYHPLPWKALTYDTAQGGYVVDLDKRKLEGAPSYRAGEEPTYDRAYGERVYGYYGLPYGAI